MNLEEMLPKMTEFFKNEAKTDTVIGVPFQLGEFHCVPVIRVGLGFGSGMGEGGDPKAAHGEGVGLAGGIGVEPIGFLVTRQDAIMFLPVKSNMSTGINAAFEKLPNLLEKYMDLKKNEPAHN